MGWQTLLSSAWNRLWGRSHGSQRRPRGARPLSAVVAEIARTGHASVRTPRRYRAEQLRSMIQSLETRTLYSITQIGTAPSQFTNSNTLANYTIPAGTDRLLVVTASDPNATNVTGVTFGGVAMTEAIDQTDSYSSDSIWYLHLGTGSAVTGNIVMSSGSSLNRFLAAMTLAGVAAVNPVDGAQGAFVTSTGNPSLTVNSENGDLVFGVVDYFNFYSAPGISPGDGQLSIHSQSGIGWSSGYNSFNTILKAGVGNTALSWSTSSAAAYIAVAVNINGANLPPTVALQNPISLAENSDTSSATKVADIVVTDDSYGISTLSLSGADAANFEIVGTELRLKSGGALNYEAKSSYDVTVNVDDTSVGGTPDASANFTLNITDVNEAPTGMLPSNLTTILAENTSTAAAIKLFDFAIEDDALGTNDVSLSGADAANFELVGTALYLKAGVSLNFEAKATYLVNVNVDDASVGNTPDAVYGYGLAIIDVNEAPTTFANTSDIKAIPESTSTADSILLSGFTINDDALGVNEVSLSGNDAAYFEMVGTNLYLKAGVSLDYETQSTYNVQMNVDDPSVGNSPDFTIAFTLLITDVAETPIITTIADQIIAPNTTTSALSFQLSDADAHADLVVNTSGMFAQPLRVGTATFGAQLFQLTGDLILADPILATSALTNAAQVAGKIAVIDRGTASYVTKVKHAQDAGAIGVIIVNNAVGSTPPGMAGTDASLIIPVLSISQSNGNILKTAIADGGVNVSLRRGRDVDFATVAASSSNTALVPENQIVISGTGANRTVTVTPMANATGTTAITLTVSDGGLTTTKTFDVTVNALPVAQASTVTTDEDTPKTFAVSDFSFTDAENNALVAISVSNLTLASGDTLTVDQGAGRVNVTNGMTITAAQIPTLQYTPASNANGNDRSRFDFTVNDALAGTVAATMKLHVAAVNDAPVKFAQTFRILENSRNGAWIGAMTGTDLEDGTALNYAKVSGDSQLVFIIEHGNLYINKAQFLDFETTQELTLMVVAADTSAAVSTPAQIKVELIDVNEAPVVTPTQFLIGENSANNAFIGNIASRDVDAGQTRTYAIVAGNTNDAFRIDAASGVLRVNNSAALDFEAVQRFDLTVRATDNGTPARSGTATVTVFLRNENDAPVVTATDFLIGENSNSDAIIGTIPVSDQDANQTRSFSIVAGNTDNAFRIDVNGALRVNNSVALNYETVQRFDLVVRVVDNGTPARAGTALVRVFLRDVNEVPAVVPTEFLIGENSLAGAFIGQIPVKDVDAGQTHQYAIAAGNVGEAFFIDANTGVLRVNNPQSLDYETIQRFDLTVRVVDSGTPAIANWTIIKVHLRDVNEIPQVQTTQFLINENAPNGALIGNVPVFDPDAGQSRTYSIVSGNRGDAFSIDPATGALRVNSSRSLNFEEFNRFELIVKAIDNGNPALTGVGPVTIFLRDVNEAPVVLAQDFLIRENSADGAFIGVIRGLDPDLGPTPVYSVVDGNTNDAFIIDPTLGTLRVNNSAALDFETNPQFNLTVRLTDAVDPTLFSTSQVRVFLRDVAGARTAPLSSSSMETSTVIVPSSSPQSSSKLGFLAHHKKSSLTLNRKHSS